MMKKCKQTNKQTCYDDASRVADLALAVAREARVIADVLGLDHRYPELGPVVHDPYGGRRLDRVCVLVPEYLGRGRALSLAV